MSCFDLISNEEKKKKKSEKGKRWNFGVVYGDNRGWLGVWGFRKAYMKEHCLITKKKRIKRR